MKLDWSQVGIGGVGANGASVSSGQPDKSGLSPGSPPTVLDAPVAVSDAYQQHSMVDIDAAPVQNSRPIGWPVWSIDGHWDGSAYECVEQDLTPRHIYKARNLQFVAFGSFALLVSAHIGVLLVSGNPLVLDVLEGRVHPPPVAAHIPIGTRAVHQLLLRISRLTCRIIYPHCTLNCCYRWKGPAGSAGCLVFHCAHCS